MSSIILTTGTPSTGGSPMPAETPASKPTSAESQSVLKPRKRMTRMGLLAIAVSVACGTFGGVGAFTFGYGEGAAYLSNNPASCANCHVMQAHYDSWLKSSHENVATCNDCHLPHHPLGKWITKADNGFFHSLAFTTGDFHEPIQIKQRNRTVTQQACLHCHSEYVNHMLPAEPGGDMLMCIHCHSDVGHSQR